MKVRVNAEDCRGHGLCAMRSPQVYVLNEDGFNDMQDFEVAADRQSAATLGALACPERAIAVED